MRARAVVLGRRAAPVLEREVRARALERRAQIRRARRVREPFGRVLEPLVGAAAVPARVLGQAQGAERARADEQAGGRAPGPADHPQKLSLVANSPDGFDPACR